MVKDQVHQRLFGSESGEELMNNPCEASLFCWGCKIVLLCLCAYMERKRGGFVQKSK